MYEEQGKNDIALAKHEESLRIKIKVHGHEHTDVAASLGNMGVLFCEMEKYDKALEHFDRAQGIVCAALGRDHHRFHWLQVGRAVAMKGASPQAEVGTMYADASRKVRDALGKGAESVISDLEAMWNKMN